MSEIDNGFVGENFEDEDDMQGVLASIAAEGDAAVSMKVYRMRGGKREWLFDALPSEAETMQETLRDSYGGGDFEVMIRKGNRIAKRKQLFIAAPLKRETDRQKSPDADMAAVMLQGFNGLAAGISELGKLLIQTQQSQMLAPAKSPQDQLQETLNLMVTMKSVFDTGTKADPMEQFLKGINFAKEIAIENDPDNEPSAGKVLMSLADKLAPVLEATLSAPKMPDIRRMNPTPAIQARSQPQPQPQRPKPQQPTTQPQGNDMNVMMKMAIKNQLAQLVKFASVERDPVIYSTVVLDSIPDAYFEQFAEFICKPQAVEELAKIDPAVNSYREWFNELHKNIVDQLTTSEDGDMVDITEDTGIEQIHGTNPNDSATDGDSIG